jgi:hypothetical protein
VEVQRSIPVFCVETPQFEEPLTSALANKRNIILVGRSEHEVCKVISKAVPLEGYCPDIIHRWGIYSLSDVLSPDDLNRLLSADRAGKTICIVEQLKLPGTKPPRVKPVIVYSEPQGVVKETDTLEEAKKFLAANRAHWSSLEKFPLAGIYQWQNGEWEKLRVFV